MVLFGGGIFYLLLLVFIFVMTFMSLRIYCLSLSNLISIFYATDNRENYYYYYDDYYYPLVLVIPFSDDIDFYHYMTLLVTHLSLF